MWGRNQRSIAYNGYVYDSRHTSEHFLAEASKALDKLTNGRDKLDTLESYTDGSSLFNKQQQLND